MNCHDAREWFSAWADDTLGIEVRARLDAHLAGCADCRRELDRFAGTVALLRQVERPRAPAGFVDRVLAAARPAPWYRRLFRGPGPSRWGRLPVEAVAVVLVATLAVYVFQRSPELQQASRQEVPAPPRSDAAAPKETASRDDVLRDSAAEARPPLAAESPLGKSAARARRSEAERGALDSRTSSPEGRVAPPAPSQPPGGGAVPREAEEAAPPSPPVASARPQTQGEPGPAASPPAARSEARGERVGILAAPRPAEPSVTRLVPAADVVGRLTVRDRPAAERQLAELLTRAAGTEISRRVEGDATVVDLLVPQPAYAEFARGLARMGGWVAEREPAAMPARILVTLRISE